MASIQSKRQKRTTGKVFIVKRRLYDHEEEIHGKSPGFYLKKMQMHESDGYFRKNMFGTEIIWNGRKMHFSTRRSKKSYKHFFIFALVKKDAVNYLKTHTVKKSKWLPSVYTNENFVHKKNLKVRGIDIDTAYWVIAYRLGIITQNTYEKGIMIPDKNMALAALASLGSDKRYSIIKNGLPTNDYKMVKGDDQLKEVYKMIRFTCYKYIRRVAALLGNDYVHYRTDAIYHKDTLRNRKIVHDFMEKYDFDYKIAPDISEDKNNNDKDYI
jgi:hypothetical protein